MKTFTKIFIAASIVLFGMEDLVAQKDTISYLKDRGTGQPTSMFGTYINKGEFLVYPFYEYYYDKNTEYAPNELGGQSDTDYRGKYTANEGLIFLGYGITDRLAIEFEAAYISARLQRSGDDPEGANEVIEESGIGDIESQIRWRWNKETKKSPEFFSYFETVFPFQEDKLLIGTQNWEFKLGSGMVKGFAWGTMTLRVAAEYDAGEKVVELGEYAIEYLKRVSPLFRFYLGVEGSQDEVEFITDLQFHFNRTVMLRINNSFGVTSKATDYAPEVGVLFRFR